MAGARTRSLLALAVVALALGAVAATVDSGTLSGGDPEPGSPEVDLELPELPDEERSGTLCPDPLRETRGVAAFAGIVALAGAAIARWRPGAAPLAAAVGAPLVLGGAACSSLLEAVPGLGQIAALAPSPAALLVGLVIALGGALAFLYVRADDPVGLDGEIDLADEPVDLESVGRAAGAAADRIEAQADVTNEVYRAWTEMVRHLRVPNPEATTPDEFERRAVEAGMDADDVSELTRLFEEVRYGERDPETREERAIAALRRIERAYASGSDGDGVDRDADAADGGDDE